MKAKLNCIRMVSDLLRDEATGLNAAIAALSLDAGDVAPQPVAAILDPTRHDEAVTGNQVRVRPAVFVTVPSRFQAAGVLRHGRRRELTIPVIIVYEAGASGAWAKQYVQMEYTMDALQSCLDTWLELQPAGRSRHGTMVLACERQEYAVHRTDGGLQVSVVLYLNVRDSR